MKTAKHGDVMEQLRAMLSAAEADADNVCIAVVAVRRDTDGVVVGAWGAPPNGTFMLLGGLEILKMQLASKVEL